METPNHSDDKGWAVAYEDIVHDLLQADFAVYENRTGKLQNLLLMETVTCRSHEIAVDHCTNLEQDSEMLLDYLSNAVQLFFEFSRFHHETSDLIDLDIPSTFCPSSNSVNTQGAFHRTFRPN